MVSQVVPPEKADKLSDDLRQVLEAADGKPMRIRDMVEILRGRGLQVVVILLCLPFLTPVTLPGISIPFGLAIALCGLRIAFGQKPWLPDVILRQNVSFAVLEKMVEIGCKIYGKLEKVIKPRLEAVFSAPGMMQVVGAAIALSGILLSLPIPPPFILTNMIPGMAIIFLSLGLMERDGVMIVAGYVLAIIGTVYVGVIFLIGKAGVEQVWRMITGG